MRPFEGPLRVIFDCREGLWGMVGVDKIGQVRRAYFEQHRSIKEIVRTLSVSRATVVHSAAEPPLRGQPLNPSGHTPLDDSGMVQDESGGAAGGGLGGASKDSPVASLSRWRPRAAV